MPEVIGISKTRNKGSILKRTAPLFFISLVFLAWLFSPKTCVTVRCGDRLLLVLPVRVGEVFEVEFMHSLNRSPVSDVFECTENGMILRKSVFKAFGAGIPVPADGIGTELVHVDGNYELRGIDRPMNGFSIMLQEFPNHRISFNDRELRLLDVAEAGACVEVSAGRLPRLVRLINILKTEVQYVKSRG